MSAQGVNIAEEMHVIPALYSVSGTSTTDIWNMQNAAHATVILNQGVGGSAVTVTVQRCTTNAGGTTSAVEFSAYLASGTDVLSARSAVSSAGFTLGSGNNQIAVIEINADAFSKTAKYCRVAFSGSAPNLISAVAILSGYRLASESSPTQLT